MADERALKTITFPSISTGAYGYPIEDAAPLAIRTVAEHLAGASTLEEVTFVLFGRAAYGAYEAALKTVK
jgi:O-acetyl-ADP-ribose deacetylase (regulator of RNase III)